MNRDFSNLGALCSYLDGVVRKMPQAEMAALDEAATFMLSEIKKIPGHYAPKWAELVAATKADRARKGFPENDPLLRGGQLRDSYGKRVEGDRHHAEVGSNDPRAEMFEMGTSRMPPRPVLGTAQAQQEHKLPEMIAKRLHQHMGGEV